ncbi:MAG: DUF6036 family nucleotidyltransferase [Myxococcaceae bacterium]
MTREQLAHVLRAAARIAGDPAILVIGSQAILGSHDAAELPEVAWLSVEADIAFLDRVKGAGKADEVDGAIGELSQFHQTNSYYAQGVDLNTAKLPAGWESRLVAFQPASADPARAMCLEKHDLVISKLVAMREKDQAFALALLEAGLVDIGVLVERANALTDVGPVIAQNVMRWLEAARKRLPVR